MKNRTNTQKYFVPLTTYRKTLLSNKVYEDQRSSALSNLLKSPPLKTREFSIKASEMAILANSRWQNCKERPNRSTNKGDMTTTVKRYIVRQ